MRTKDRIADFWLLPRGFDPYEAGLFDELCDTPVNGDLGGMRGPGGRDDLLERLVSMDQWQYWYPFVLGALSEIDLGEGSSWQSIWAVFDGPRRTPGKPGALYLGRFSYPVPARDGHKPATVSKTLSGSPPADLAAVLAATNTCTPSASVEAALRVLHAGGRVEWHIEYDRMGTLMRSAGRALLG